MEPQGFRGEARRDARGWRVQHGHPEPAHLDRPAPLTTPLNSAPRASRFVLVVGGGQGGIGIRRAAEAHRRAGADRRPAAAPGDAWRHSATSRSACTTRSGSTICRTCRSPTIGRSTRRRDKMGDWLEVLQPDHGARLLVLGACRSASGTRPNRNGPSSSSVRGQACHASTQALVLATGMSGFPKCRAFPAPTASAARSIIRASIAAARASAASAAVVVGSNNSAHDIAADLWEHGADVTMIQRSPTLVVRSRRWPRRAHFIRRRRLGGHHHRPCRSHRGLAALCAAAFSHPADGRAAQSATMPPSTNVLAMARFHADASATTRPASARCMLRRGSGYCIDVGASELIADGRIKLRRRRRGGAAHRGLGRSERRQRASRPTSWSMPRATAR